MLQRYEEKYQPVFVAFQYDGDNMMENLLAIAQDVNPDSDADELMDELYSLNVTLSEDGTVESLTAMEVDMDDAYTFEEDTFDIDDWIIFNTNNHHWRVRSSVSFAAEYKEYGE